MSKWKRFSEANRNERSFEKPPSGFFYLVIWDEDPDKIHHVSHMKTCGGSGWFSDVADVVTMPEGNEPKPVKNRAKLIPLVAASKGEAHRYCVEILGLERRAANCWQDLNAGIILKLANSVFQLKGYDHGTPAFIHNSIMIHPRFKYIMREVDSRFIKCEDWSSLKRLMGD